MEVFEPIEIGRSKYHITRDAGLIEVTDEDGDGFLLKYDGEDLEQIKKQIKVYRQGFEHGQAAGRRQAQDEIKKALGLL